MRVYCRQSDGPANVLSSASGLPTAIGPSSRVQVCRRRSCTDALVQELMGSHQDFDIAIIGAGPVGTFLANLLGVAGLHVLLLDREFDIYQLPRAVHFD